MVDYRFIQDASLAVGGGLLIASVVGIALQGLYYVQRMYGPMVLTVVVGIVGALLVSISLLLRHKRDVVAL